MSLFKTEIPKSPMTEEEFAKFHRNTVVETMGYLTGILQGLVYQLEDEHNPGSDEEIAALKKEINNIHNKFSEMTDPSIERFLRDREQNISDNADTTII